MAVTYEPIATTTLGSAATGVTFSSISSAYTDLVIVCKLIQVSNASDYAAMQFNGNSSGYSSIWMGATNSSTIRARYANDSQIPMAAIVGDPNSPYVITASINNYANSSTWKNALIRVSASGTQVVAGAGAWRNNSAINQIYIYSAGGGSKQFNTGSTITLYGVKAA